MLPNIFLLSQDSGTGGVYFLAEDRHGLARLAVWYPEGGEVNTLRDFQGRIARGYLDPRFHGCELMGPSLHCVIERADTPQTLYRVPLDPAQPMTTLFAPNAELAELSYPQVEYLTWTSDLGEEATGALFYPANFEAGKTYPLVVTLYRCRGYREEGGSGDLPSEYLLSDQGFFALCVDGRLNDAPISPDSQYAHIHALGRYTRPLADIEAGVRMIMDRGYIDPERLGIAGQSYGAMVLAFTLIHSDLFSVAFSRSTSGISDAQVWLSHPDGGHARRGTKEHGIAFDDPRRDEALDAMSVGRNPDRIDAAWLIHASDSELWLSLDGFGRLRHNRNPIEMIIYPYSYHAIGVKPAQELSNQERALDWFKYWLGDAEAVAELPEHRRMRWDRLREQREAMLAGREGRAAEGGSP